MTTGAFPVFVAVGEVGAEHGDVAVLAEFDSIPNFDQLRIDPYLRATAAKHPKLDPVILAEAERLMHSRECLIHGDFSPKNILFNDERLVPLDCEVACYADAAFDLSFFLNHLFLKSLYYALKKLPFDSMIAMARSAYSKANPEHAESVEARTAHLLPMLMLARVDGKSPAEYLDAEKQDYLRRFACELITEGSLDLDQIQSRWFETLYQ